ncbi:MAG: hypothetical protein P1P87_09680 [Trueperaceae bacterium]|nr:hypothetical protein [Trueperaceae bacterium]
MAASLLIAAAAVAQPQTLRAAGITTSAELLAGPTDAALAFEVRFDTHAGDLLAFDLAASAALERGAGSPIPGTFTYHPESDGGHHRRGELRFVPAADADLTLPIELVLRGVGVPEWRFRWEAVGAVQGAAATVPTPEATPSVPVEGSASSRVMYVAVIGDGAVAAIDTNTFDLLWTLVVSEGTDARPPESAMGLALSPDGRTLYTGDAATGELIVVDTERREIVARVALDHGIHAIDLAPDGRNLWVDGALEGYPWLSASSVIDTASLEVVRRLAPALGSAAHLRFTPDGREVWAPSVSTNLAWIWDASTGAVLAAIPLTNTALVGDSPEGAQGLIGFNEIAMAPDGRTAYAVGPEAARVHAIDVARREVLSTAQAGARAHGIAVRPDGREVWTANRAGSVTIFDAATLEELATLDLGAYANHVAFTGDGAFALVGRDTDVAVIDVAERTIVRLVEVGRAPHEFAGEPTGGAADTATGR